MPDPGLGPGVVLSGVDEGPPSPLPNRKKYIVLFAPVVFKSLKSQTDLNQAV